MHREEATALVVAGIGAKRIAEHDRRRVRRIICLDKRIFGHCLRAKPETNKGRCQLSTLNQLHILSLFRPKKAIFIIHHDKITLKMTKKATQKSISRGQVINMP
jgi:hypothetical protein